MTTESKALLASLQERGTHLLSIQRRVISELLKLQNESELHDIPDKEKLVFRQNLNIIQSLIKLIQNKFTESAEINQDVPKTDTSESKYLTMKNVKKVVNLIPPIVPAKTKAVSPTVSRSSSEEISESSSEDWEGLEAAALRDIEIAIDDAGSNHRE